MNITLPRDVSKIISALEDHGFEAFAVGGCVRDVILGREPEDWDITTSAKPEEIKDIYSRTIDTGIEHGTVKVMLGREGYEVTTYRIDGKYSDNRHPDKVASLHLRGTSIPYPGESHPWAWGSERNDLRQSRAYRASEE